MMLIGLRWECTMPIRCHGPLSATLQNETADYRYYYCFYNFSHHLDDTDRRQHQRLHRLIIFFTERLISTTWSREGFMRKTQFYSFQLARRLFFLQCLKFSLQLET